MKLFNKRFCILLGTLIFCFSPGPCLAAEIDTITPVPSTLPDSTALLNDIINARLDEGINAANVRQNGFSFFSPKGYCDEEALYTELRKAIFQSLSISLGLKGYSLDKQLRELLYKESYVLFLEESIYRDIGFFEGVSLNLKELSSVIRIGDHIIGLDKVGHFFAEGWSYFERTWDKRMTLTEAMEWGVLQEEGKFGFLTTGVFSYADLVANFQGFRFWNGLRKTRQDPLKGIFADLFSSRQISCGFDLIASFQERKIVRKWILNKPFDITDYVDGTWDEANNCNKYKDTVIAEKVWSRIEEVRPGFRCPAETEVCIIAAERYKCYGKGLLHPNCLDRVSSPTSQTIGRQ